MKPSHSGVTLLGVSLAIALAAGAAVRAQSGSPVVTMRVTLSDGQIKELTAHESSLARISMSDGSEIGVRPTILDSKPWSRVVLTFFKMPTGNQASEEIGQMDVRTGASPVQTKTSPSFKIAVTDVSESRPST